MPVARCQIPPTRPTASIVGGTYQFVLGIIIGGIRVFVEVESGKSTGALPVTLVVGIGQTEEVEVDVAFPLVELIIPALIFLVHQSKIGELARDGVPLALAQIKQMVTAAQQIE